MVVYSALDSAETSVSDLSCSGTTSHYLTPSFAQTSVCQQQFCDVFLTQMHVVSWLAILAVLAGCAAGTEDRVGGGPPPPAPPPLPPLPQPDAPQNPPDSPPTIPEDTSSGTSPDTVKTKIAPPPPVSFSNKIDENQVII